MSSDRSSLEVADELARSVASLQQLLATARTLVDPNAQEGERLDHLLQLAERHAGDIGANLPELIPTAHLAGDDSGH